MFILLLFLVRLSEEKGACDAQVLWAACQALSRAIKVSSPGTSSNESIRPLEAEIKAVAKVARKYGIYLLFVLLFKLLIEDKNLFLRIILQLRMML